MKHLQKAFSTHRLIRSQPVPEDVAQAADALLSQPERLTEERDSETEPNWQRRRMRLHPSAGDNHKPCEFIALWDENGISYSKKI